MKQNQLLKPEAIIRSLRTAFDTPFDIELPITRMRGMINHFPPSSLSMHRRGGRVQFYEKDGSDKKYLSKKSKRIYLIARGQYLRLLLDVLQAWADYGDSAVWEKQFEKLVGLIRDFEAGNLDVARIVLSPHQYEWFTKKYTQKPFTPDPGSTPLFIGYGNPVRTKSEQNVGNALWDFAVPAHYEEQLRINVQNLVASLEAGLTEQGLLSQKLYYYKYGTCYWNVPKHLEWMNAQGSIWLSFDQRTRRVTLHPDYTIMLADDSLVYFEHEGLLDNFRYRCNATERTAVMRMCGGVTRENLIETTEMESNDPAALEEIIKTRILPRLWF